MMKHKNAGKVVLITIGSEILNGEIVNTNASHLSRQLLEYGYRVVRHITVNDIREEMLWAIQEAESISSLIITTGGLGPTSDDRTREVISEWLEQPLQENSEVKLRIQQKIEKRKVKLKPTHLKQALFPSEATVLPNQAGTAEGFYSSKNDVRLLVLPGPPREIQSIWEDGGARLLLQSWAPKEGMRLFIWKCENVPESDVAEVIEDIIAGEDIEVAYRASSPNVYVKLWLSSDNLQEIKTRVDKKLAAWLSQS